MVKRQNQRGRAKQFAVDALRPSLSNSVSNAGEPDQPATRRRMEGRRVEREPEEDELVEDPSLAPAGGF